MFLRILGFSPGDSPYVIVDLVPSHTRNLGATLSRQQKQFHERSKWVTFLSDRASAISITQDTSAASLVAALLSAAPGVTVTSSSLSGLTDGPAASSGTYTNIAGTYGISPGIVLSSGNVSDYNTGANLETGRTTDFGGFDASPASAPQEFLLDQITGGALDHYDATQLDITFDVDLGVSSVFFNVVFGSDEFSEFVGSSFIDAFGIFLNGVNIAKFSGLPVNIDHPNMAAIAGTELDGILDPTSGAGNPIMLFQGLVTPGSVGNTITFIIADSADSQLDSTVFIQGFGAEDPGGGTVGGGLVSLPEPTSLAILGLGLICMAGFQRRRKQQD